MSRIREFIWPQRPLVLAGCNFTSEHHLEGKKWVSQVSNFWPCHRLIFVLYPNNFPWSRNSSLLNGLWEQQQNNFARKRQIGSRRTGGGRMTDAICLGLRRKVNGQEVAGCFFISTTTTTYPSRILSPFIQDFLPHERARNPPWHFSVSTRTSIFWEISISFCTTKFMKED